MEEKVSKFNSGLKFGLLLFGLLATACSGQPTDIVSHGGAVQDYVSFVDNLRAKGLTVEPAGTVDQPFFVPEANIVKANDQEIQVFEFLSVAEADSTAETISQDGSSVGTSMMMWVGPPHFYKAERIIVLYVGEDEGITSILTDVLGPQVAGK